ncbi:hypothetical protein IT568_08935, partial [bacterium]|nr:hypothetical protein [bacterium]
MINLIFVLLACLSLISCSSEEKKLFEQATQLIKLAKETEKISYKDAAKLYNQAQTKIDSINSQFPKSELARKISEGNLEIDIFPISEFENSILPKAQLKAQAEENPLDCALLFSQKIDSDYLKILTLTELSDAFLKNGNTEKAEKLLPQAFGISEKILESSYKTNALIKIANGFIDQKKFGEAFTVTQKISNFPSQVLLLTQIAIETQDSLLLKKTMEETKIGFNPDEILAQIIQKFSENSNFQKAIETSQKMENPFPKARILSELAGKLIEKNETELAKTLLLQALEEANKITEKTSQTIVLTKISVNFAEANDFQQALFTAYKISDKTAKSWVLIKIASQFAKQKNYTEAFKTSQKITENNSKVFAFLEIGNAFFENSEPEKAFEVLSFALNTTLKITEPTQKIDFLLEIAKKYFAFGEFEKAKQTLLQALNLAKTLVNFQTQNDQFKKIAVA